jgi:hypothetical protein
MSCKKCIKEKNCPDPFTKELIESILVDEDEQVDMKKLCYLYQPDPSDDIEFIVNMWI